MILVIIWVLEDEGLALCSEGKKKVGKEKWEVNKVCGLGFVVF